MLQILHEDEVGGVAGAYEACWQPIVPYRVDTGGEKHLVEVDATGDGAGTKAIDMSCQETVGVLVVAAEHHLLGPVVQQPDERIEILCGAALPDEDFHPRV